MKNNKLLFLVASLLMVTTLTGCKTGNNTSNSNTNGGDSSSKVSTKTIVVFAAASMTESMNQIKEAFEKEHKNIKITYNFDSSGTLKTQIENGADCDIFISAAQKQMNALDKESETEGALDFVDHSTRVNLLENKVTLVVPKNNPFNVQSFDDLKKHLTEKTKGFVFGMGNSDVPVGQYTQKILHYLGLNEEELSKSGLISYGSNVKEVTTHVSEGSVSCGTIYATDAYSGKLTVVEEATTEMCGGQVIYPAAIMKNAKNVEETKTFFEYIKGSKASEIFESVLFTPLFK